MRIEEAVKLGKENLIKENVEEALLKTRLLLCYILDKPKEYLIINSKEILSKKEEKSFLEALEKLKAGYPLQYITHKQFFRNCEIYVDESVLIPRPDTEILVEEVLKLIRKKETLSILDLCTGSGAIAISLAKETNAKITATDISQKALDIARKNAKLNNTKINFIQGDLFENIPKENKFDIIVSNPPYIETETIKDLSKEVKNEPIIALDGGIDGLDFYRRIAFKAKNFLNADGYLALEIGYNQKAEVYKILLENRFTEILSVKDFSGNDRVIIAKSS